jgi:hypothetical protein
VIIRRIRVDVEGLVLVRILEKCSLGKQILDWIGDSGVLNLVAKSKEKVNGR